METVTHKRIHDLLVASHHPILISDERLDGDCLGSALAVADFLFSLGVDTKVFVAQSIPDAYKFLPHIHKCTTDVEIFNDSTIDLVVVFDCSDENFVSKLVDRIPSKPIVINIDHHKTNTHYGSVNQVIADASATAQVVYGFFDVNRLYISREAATCLLTGLCFDTNIFSNSATNETVLTIASDLILGGARVQDVIRTIFYNRSISVLRVWGLALERLFIHPTMNLVTTCLTQQDIISNNVTDDEIDGLSNFLSLVTDVETLFVMCETKEGGVKVSMRSHARDVSVLARALGGGGHAKAAGFTIPNSKLVNSVGGLWKVCNGSSNVRFTGS